MDALRPQILRKALRENALGSLRRREGRAHRDAANDEVFPVTMIAPSPRSIIAGASFWARKNSDVVLTRKFRSRSATEVSLAKVAATTLWTSTWGRRSSA